MVVRLSDCSRETVHPEVRAMDDLNDLGERNGSRLWDCDESSSTLSWSVGFQVRFGRVQVGYAIVKI